MGDWAIHTDMDSVCTQRDLCERGLGNVKGSSIHFPSPDSVVQRYRESPSVKRRPTTRRGMIEG